MFLSTKKTQLEAQEAIKRIPGDTKALLEDFLKNSHVTVTGSENFVVGAQVGLAYTVLRPNDSEIGFGTGLGMPLSSIAVSAILASTGDFAREISGTRASRMRKQDKVLHFGDELIHLPYMLNMAFNSNQVIQDQRDMGKAGIGQFSPFRPSPYGRMYGEPRRPGTNNSTRDILAKMSGQANELISIAYEIADKLERKTGLKATIVFDSVIRYADITGPSDSDIIVEDILSKLRRTSKAIDDTDNVKISNLIYIRAAHAHAINLIKLVNKGSDGAGTDYTGNSDRITIEALVSRNEQNKAEMFLVKSLFNKEIDSFATYGNCGLNTRINDLYYSDCKLHTGNFALLNVKVAVEPELTDDPVEFEDDLGFEVDDACECEVGSAGGFDDAPGMFNGFKPSDLGSGFTGFGPNPFNPFGTTNTPGHTDDIDDFWNGFFNDNHFTGTTGVQNPSDTLPEDQDFCYYGCPIALDNEPKLISLILNPNMDLSNSFKAKYI